MAQHRLGQKEEAQASLARLQEIMQQKAWAKDAEAQAVLREAETLLGTPPK